MKPTHLRNSLQLILVIAAILWLVSCKKDIEQNESLSFSTNSNASVEHEAEYTRLSVTIVGNDNYIKSLPKTTRIGVLEGDSWNDNHSYAWGYANELVPNNIVVRAIYGTTFASNKEFLQRLTNIAPWVSTLFVHLGTNDIGLGYSLSKIETDARAWFALAFTIIPYAEINIQTVEPHPKFWIDSIKKQKILDVNALYERLASEYRSQGKKVKVINTFALFINSDGTPNSLLFDKTQYHYNSDGEIKVRKFILDIFRNSTGESINNTDTTTNPDPQPSNIPPTAIAYTSATSTTLSSGWFPILNGNLSKDTDGWITNYVWTQVSGPSCTITPILAGRSQVTNWSAGIYVFKLTVTDNKGANSSVEHIITVTNN